MKADTEGKISAYEQEQGALEHLLDIKDVIKLTGMDMKMFFKTGKNMLSDKSMESLKEVNFKIYACENKINNFEKDELIKKYIKTKKTSEIEYDINKLKTSIDNLVPSAKQLEEQKVTYKNKINKLNSYILPKQEEKEIEL